MRKLKTIIKKGALDRIESKKAIIIADDYTTYHYPAHNLPKNIKEGVRLVLYLNNENIINIKEDRMETKKIKESLIRKIQELKKRK
jgi:hypothetical protein